MILIKFSLYSCFLLRNYVFLGENRKKEREKKWERNNKTMRIKLLALAKR
jgi:hypothetical protein